IGFSYLLICSLYFFLNGKVAEDTIFSAMAFVYPVGFIMVILGQSILFTEQTSLLTLPVLNKKRSISSLLKLWGLVILGNLIGGYLIAFLLMWFGPHLNIFDLQTIRSEEHTSELQSRENLVCRLLLEKKNMYIEGNACQLNFHAA